MSDLTETPKDGVDIQLTKLLKGGIASFTIGLNERGQPFVQCDQVVQTAGPNDISTLKHQRVDTTIGRCIAGLTPIIEHCAKLNVPSKTASNLIALPPGAKGN